MLNAINNWLGTDKPTDDDVQRVERQLADAQHKRQAETVAMQKQQERITAQRLERAELLIQQTEGEDCGRDLQRLDNALATAEKKRQEHEDVIAAYNRRADGLTTEIRQVRSRRAPGRAVDLAAEYKAGVERLLEYHRQAEAEAVKLLELQYEGERLNREFGAEIRATPIDAMKHRDAAAELHQLLANHTRTTAQAVTREREVLADLERRSAEVDRLNKEAGYDLYEKPDASRLLGYRPRVND
jgi:hypothetical protein